MKLRSGTEVEFLNQAGLSSLPRSQKRFLNREPPTPAAPAKRARLTADNLKWHTIATNPTDMPNKCDPSSNTTCTTTTDPAFGAKLDEKGIIHYQTEIRRPADYAVIIAELDRRRVSGSASLQDWAKYQRRVDFAVNEDAIRNYVCSDFLRSPGMKDLRQEMNVPWTKVDNIDVTSGLSDPRPDYTEGFELKTYPEEARSALGGHLQPSRHPFAMPRFAVELKQPEKGLRQAGWQAAYDGAVMVSAARAQDRFKGQPFAYGQTQALTATSNGENMRLYANHAVQSQGGTQFHHALLFGNEPHKSKEEFSAARRRIRNAQDWSRVKASEARDSFREHANRMTQFDTTGLEGVAEEPEEREAELEYSRKPNDQPESWLGRGLGWVSTATNIVQYIGI